MQKLIDDGVIVDMILTDPPYNISLKNKDTVDIWENYLLIKADCPNYTLDRHSIKKALNLGNASGIHCVESNMCYAINRWK